MTRIWHHSSLGIIKLRLAPRDDDATVHSRTCLPGGLCPHPGRGREPRSLCKAGTGQPFVKSSLEKTCPCSREEAGKSVVFLVFWWESLLGEIVTLSLLKVWVWGPDLKYLLRVWKFQFWSMRHKLKNSPLTYEATGAVRWNKCEIKSIESFPPPRHKGSSHSW